MDSHVLTQIFIILLTTKAILSSMAPSDSDKSHQKDLELMKKYWRKQADEPHQKDIGLIKNHWKNAQVDQNQNTQSDAMELYSISAKKVLILKQKETLARPGSNTASLMYDPIFELSVTNTRNTKLNKFITETISFQNLRIQSQENDKYLCATNSKEIVFKVDKTRSQDREYSSPRMRNPTNSKKKPRKRCQFTWDFTDQMHIKLSVTPRRTTLFLTVKKGVVMLTEEHESTELERSFIWVPTKNAQNAHKKYKKKKNKKKRHTGDNQRSFPIGSLKDAKETKCANGKQLKHYKNKLASCKRNSLKIEMELERAKLRLSEL